MLLYLALLAGDGLGRLRDGRALELIETGARQESEPLLRQWYMNALSASRRPERVAVLLDLLSTTDILRRSMVLRALRPCALDRRVFDAALRAASLSSACAALSRTWAASACAAASRAALRISSTCSSRSTSARTLSQPERRRRSSVPAVRAATGSFSGPSTINAMTASNSSLPKLISIMAARRRRAYLASLESR